jgi:polar amino acid transport system substrate-binding protein
VSRLYSAFAAVLCSLSLFSVPIQGAPLAEIRERGTLRVCAHPDALPFSSQDRTQPGFQLEIAEAIAKHLGVKLHVDWIIFTYHARRANCDAIMGSIVPRGQEGKTRRRLRLTKPYVGSGYVLVVPPSAANARRVEDLHGTIGVQHASWPHYLLDTQGIRTLSYGNQMEIIEAIAKGEVVAGLVAQAYAGWYLKQHPDGAVTIAKSYETDPELQWNVAVGLQNADDALVNAVNQALERLLANQTIQGIFAKYGVTYTPPFTQRRTSSHDR